jgi:transcriptional regulator with XRE-family HTH domain
MSTQTLRKLVRRAARATFSDELRDQIERSGLTPYALGKRADVDPGILSRFLSGRRGMTTDTIDRIAAALNLHLGTAVKSKGRPRRDALVGTADPELDQAEASGEIEGPDSTGDGEETTP